MKNDIKKREKAVLRILKGEVTQVAVAKSFGLSKAAIGLWVKQYRETGSICRSSTRGRKSAGITKVQYKKLVKSISGTNPSEHGIDATSDRWCTEAVNQLLKLECGRTYSIIFCIDILTQAGVEHPDRDEETCNALMKSMILDRKPKEIPSNSSDYCKLPNARLKFFRKTIAEGQEKLNALGLAPLY